MQRCIELALMAKAQGSTPVGSLIVKDDTIIAEGFEGENYIPAPIAHAEIIAVLKAIQYRSSKDLSHCILYTTKEPCFMCSYLIRQAKMKGVVFALRTEDTGGASSIFPILTSADFKRWPAPPFVVEGVLESECLQILK